MFESIRARFSKKPYARMTVLDIEKEGRVKFKTDCNAAFITYLEKLGFEGTNEEMINLFFFAMRMAPEDAIDPIEKPPVADATPELSSNNHWVNN